MSTTKIRGDFSRRDLLRVGAMVSVAPLVAGVTSCGPGGPHTESRNGKLATLPAYVDPPQIDGSILPKVPGVPIGYTKLPLELVTTVPEPPGRGGPLTHFSITWGAPETPLANNKWWQGLNKRLSCDFQMTSVPASNYDAKFATMLASGQLAEVVQLMNTAACTKAVQQGAFADLTDDLVGDKIKEYPNLANVRPDQWEASSIGGRIYGVPIDIPAVQPQFRLRTDWAEKLGLSKNPETAEELADLLTAMSKGRPAGGKQAWGVTAYPGTIAVVANAMFHVPNQWRLTDGKLENMIETDEYAAALGWLRDLWAAGAFHPDALALGTQSAKDLGLISSGQVGLSSVSAQNWYLPGPYRTAIDAGGLEPYVPRKHDGSGPALFARSSGSYGINALSAEAAKDPKRRKEMLRIFNYLRAPVGSAEWYYCKYGEPGDYYEPRTTPGLPKAIEGRNITTDRGTLYYGCAPQAWIFPEVAECMKINEEMVASSAPDPVQGLLSATNDARAAQLSQLGQTYVNAIISGQRPLTDLEEYRTKWREQGGDKIRDEYQQALDTRE